MTAVNPTPVAAVRVPAAGSRSAPIRASDTSPATSRWSAFPKMVTSST